MPHQSILPQYIANLTQPIGTKKAIHFTTIHCEPNTANSTKKAIYFGKLIPVLTTLCMVGLVLLELFFEFLLAF